MIQIAGWKRARPDEPHLAAHDIHELRQLVDKGAAQQGAQPGHARVALKLEQPAIRPATALQPGMQGLRPAVHRAEFIDDEGAPSEPEALLPKDNRPAVTQQHQQRRHRQRRQAERQQHQRGRSFHTAARHGTGRPSESKTAVGIRPAARVTRQHRRTLRRHRSGTVLPNGLCNESQDLPLPGPLSGCEHSGHIC